MRVTHRVDKFLQAARNFFGIFQIPIATQKTVGQQQIAERADFGFNAQQPPAGLKPSAMRSHPGGGGCHDTRAHPAGAISHATPLVSVVSVVSENPLSFHARVRFLIGK